MTRRNLLLALLFLAPASARAQLTWYTSSALFTAGATAPVTADFEGLPYGAISSFTQGVVTFTSPGSTLFVTTPTGAARFDMSPRPASNMLVGNGPDDLLLTVAGGGTSAIGFDVATNAWAMPTVSVWDVANVFLGSYTLTQAPNTYGFFGVSSVTDIGSVRFVAVNGNIQDSGIDNVRVGVAAPAPVTTPEPTSLALLLTGASFVAIRRRYRMAA